MHDVGFSTLIFVVFAFLVGALVKAIMKNSRLPYTVVLLLIGLFIGFLDHLSFFATHSLASDIVHQVGTIDPHLILFLFLPTLIFESAYSMESHLFFRILPQIALLAVVGLVISMVLSALAVHWLLSWSFGVALLFGALISATDPVAVVALLKEKSSRKRLETLIEGESLLNDGTAIVFFSLFYGFAVGSSVEVNAISVVGEFIWVVSAGLIVGIAVAWSSLWVIGKLVDQPLIEITLSVVAAYITFIIAESLHVSGVVALVALALMYSTIGRTKISPEISHFLHQFWDMLAYLANTLIFLIVGIVIVSNTRFDSAELWISLIVLYIVLVLIRSISVIVLMPILERIGVGITRQKATVLVWGGLRGAVSLALALTIVQDTNIPEALREQILFLTAGIVFLTIVINGSTMEYLLKLLNLDKFPPAKEASIIKAEKSITIHMQSYFKTLIHNPFFDKIKIDSLGNYIEEFDTNQKIKNVDEEEIDIAFMRRLLEIERSDYWRQFEEGRIGRHATSLLSKSVESALDNSPSIYPRPVLEELFKIPTPPKWISSIPVMGGSVDKWVLTHLSLSYDIARGFVEAQEEIRSHIKKLQPSEEVAKQVEDMVDKNISKAFTFTRELNKIYPELITKLQSLSARRLLLNHERYLIWKMEHDGVLESSEAGHLIDKIEKQM
jgi:NhaP-type Na+/H+ or K+/H+ antiporter